MGVNQFPNDLGKKIILPSLTQAAMLEIEMVLSLESPPEKKSSIDIRDKRLKLLLCLFSTKVAIMILT